MSVRRSIRAFAALMVLSAAALATAQNPVAFPDPEVWQHRLSPMHLLHTESFDPRSIFVQDTVTLQVVVGADGRVESAHAIAGPSEFYAEAENLERQQRFRPFEKNGVPVRASIKDYVRLAPTEQWLSPRVPFPEIRDWSSLRMTLARTACYGMCPAYSLEVDGDGTVKYHGSAFVLVTGEHQSKISRADVEQLFAQFRAADYFSLKDAYRAGITDNPTETTSIEFEGHRKQVVDYVGSYVGMPDVVSELETAIDRIAGSDKWVHGTSATWAALVAEHWNFKARTSENAELFANVIAKGTPELVQQFVAAGAPATIMSNSVFGPRSALEVAAGKGNLDLVQRMLDTEPNVSAPVLYQSLRAAAASGNLALVRLLIGHGANVTGSPADPNDLQTVLVAAVGSGKPDVVREILRHHPDVNARSYNGKAALALYLQGGHQQDVQEVVSALLANGASVSQTDDQGRTPLFDACSTPSAVKQLVAAGADVNARDRNGETPLMNCSFRKDYVAAMLETGADPTLRDRYGTTALDHAKRMGNKEAVALLEAAMQKRATQ